MKNFNRVMRYNIETDSNDVFTGCSKSLTRGEFVGWEDYKELLTAYKSLLEKISETVGEHTFEE